MPSTYNGIGTHYYGKKNIEKRSGACQQCGRQGELTSYDTRLWFVILFIPVIPLARKRIIDYCPACTRHYAMELDKWETAKQLEISGALEKFRNDPSPEAAIAAHNQLLNFHQSAQAADFRQMMREKFADNAKVQAYLGAALSHLGQLGQAEPFYLRALELRPDLPEARVGVAVAHMRAKRLDEARKLLDYLEKPGAAQLYSLEPIENLAIAYQNAGEHEKALELFRCLQKELPRVNEHKGFRKMVAKSEKALQLKTSILPKQKFSWRRVFTLERSGRPGSPAITMQGMMIFGVIVALVILGFGIANEYIRRHRTLYLVGNLESPAKVEIPGVGTYPVKKGVFRIVLPEGDYHATINGAVTETVPFQIRADYFDRWFTDPAWVLDAGGTVLAFEEAIYSRNPRQPGQSLHFGKHFYFFPKITHPFTDLPEKLTISENETRVLTHLDLIKTEGVQVLDYFFRRKQNDEALNFAEWYLKNRPNEEGLLPTYLYVARTTHQVNRAEKFLAAGLTNRPIHIEWHRAFQNLVRDRKRDALLARNYDSMLQADPTNSALLYLRGRLCADHAEGRRFFERASQADPGNAYPVYALGFDHMAVGDWAGAKPLLSRAAALNTKEKSFSYYLNLSRVALKEFDSLEKELRAYLKDKPLDYASTVQLCDLLIETGKKDAARELVSAYETQAVALLKTTGRETTDMLWRHLYYSSGDFAALEKHADKDVSNGGKNARFYALIEQGRVEEATKIFPIDDPEESDPAHFLAVAVAWYRAGNKTEGDKWMSHGTAILEKQDDDSAHAAALLHGEKEITTSELDDIIMPVNTKAIILATLAYLQPAKAPELLAYSHRLNIGRSYPFHLLDRVASGAR